MRLGLRESRAERRKVDLAVRGQDILKDAGLDSLVVQVGVADYLSASYVHLALLRMRPAEEGLHRGQQLEDYIPNELKLFVVLRFVSIVNPRGERPEHM